MAVFVMLERQNVKDFVYSNYIPFDKRQCFKRVILVWMMSAVVFGVTYLLEKQSLFWSISIGIVVLPVSVVAFLLCFRQMTNRLIPRLISDGLFGLSLSVIFMFGSYLFRTGGMNQNWLLLVFLLFLLGTWILIILIWTRHNIKAGKYTGDNKKQNNMIPGLAAVFSALGMLIARFFLQGLSQRSLQVFESLLFMFLSLICGLGCTLLMKAYYAIHYGIEDIPE